MIDTITKDINVLRLYGDNQPIINEIPYIKVQDIPNKGRGYVATQVIPKGTLIHISEPLSTIVNQEWMPETCTHCFHFHYPKKLKLKIIQHDQELKELLLWWEDQQQQIEENNQNKKRFKKKKHSTSITCQNHSTLLSPLRFISFCSDSCKQSYLYKTFNTKDHYYWWVTCIYRLDYLFQHQEEFDSIIINHYQSNKEIEKEKEKDEMIEKEEDTFDIQLDKNDELLKQYLDQAWSILPPTTNHQQESNQYYILDKNDITICKLILSCILKYYTEQSKENVTMNENKNVSFNELWNIQDNEMTYFKHHYQQQEKEQQKKIKKKPTQWEDIPFFLQQHIQLYHYFESSLFIPVELNQYHIPYLSTSQQLDKMKCKSLFRSIFYREMANSFGLWEQSSSSQKKEEEEEEIEETVTDDLELLGFGIYPSAVYFNHSCDANLLKLRHGDQMYFYSKKLILKNDELCISYGNVNTPFLERRQRLFDHYHFLCQCQKCILEEEDGKKK